VYMRDLNSLKMKMTRNFYVVIAGYMAVYTTRKIQQTVSLHLQPKNQELTWRVLRPMPKIMVTKILAKDWDSIARKEKIEMLLNHVGYSPKISHRELVEMAKHRKELEKMAKPVLDTLRSYQDLPPFHVNDQAAIEMVKGRRSNIQKKL
ncbi:predicted protein, partial [Arabidopsis lyrata subsp. lyrata]